MKNQPYPAPEAAETPNDGILRGDARAAAIAGMRELLDVLATNPELPVTDTMFQINYYPGHHGAADTAEAVCELGTIAAALGVDVTGNGDPFSSVPTEKTTHYYAARSFGVDKWAVRYEAIHIHKPASEATS